MADFKKMLENLRDRFTQHPHSINETYPEHLRYASMMGLRLVFAGMACIIHSIFPFWFEKTGSNAVKAIHEEMIARQNKTPQH